MTMPTKIARGHAIILVVGGEYRGSVLDSSTIWSSDDNESRSREELINFSTVDSKGIMWREGWNWAKKDVKWFSHYMLDSDRYFDDGVTYNVNATTKKAIKEFDGAWVIRLRK